jgi:hypothetical protein
MQKWFCGGKVDKSVGIYQAMESHRLQGFAQFNWDAERSLGNMPDASKQLAPLFCSLYNVSSLYVGLCNKHGMFPMEPSTLCMGLCRWMESISNEYLCHLFGSRQRRDISRTLEICKSMAAAETCINYSLLYTLKSNSYSDACPKVMMACMMDPIHVHELPRLFFNYLINNVSIPLFYIVSVFQREMEVPVIPLESVIALLTNGRMCLCCVKAGRLSNQRARCTMSNSSCHTYKIKKFLSRMVERRAFLPKESGFPLHAENNIMQFITAYGSDDDVCNMQAHANFASRSAGVGSTSCMRVKSHRQHAENIQRDLCFDRDGDQSNEGSGNGASSFGDGGTNPSSSANHAQSRQQQSSITNETYRLFVREAYTCYKEQFSNHAFIKENELLCALHEMASSSSTKLARFFGDLPYMGKYKTVMQNLGVIHVPSGMPNLSSRQIFQQGSPIVTARAFISKEMGIGIDWMMMLLLLGISGSSRIDQQLAKDVSKNLVAHVFNEIPYSMYPYNHVQIKEFNPYTPMQEVLNLRPPCLRVGSLLRPDNLCLLNPSIPPGTTDKCMVPPCTAWKELMMEDMGFAAPLLDLCRMMSIRNVYNLPIDLVDWQVPYPTQVMYPVIRYGKIHKSRHIRRRDSNHASSDGSVLTNASRSEGRREGCLFVEPGGACKLWIKGKNGNRPYKLSNVGDVALKYRMGPRPLFSRPGIAVACESNSVGMIVARPDMLTLEDAPHALHRLCSILNMDSPHIQGGGMHSDEDDGTFATAAGADANSSSRSSNSTLPFQFTYTCYNKDGAGAGEGCQVSQAWVEDHIMPVGTQVWVKAWSESMEKFYSHMQFDAHMNRPIHNNSSSASGASSGSRRRIEQHMLEAEQVFVLGTLCPAKKSDDYVTVGLWVAVEVRHMHGSLKNVPFSDSLSLCICPEDLMMPIQSLPGTRSDSCNPPPPKRSNVGSAHAAERRKVLLQYLTADEHQQKSI